MSLIAGCEPPASSPPPVAGVAAARQPGPPAPTQASTQAPAQDLTPSQKVEQLVRAHLQDPALRKCIEEVLGREAPRQRVEKYLRARIDMSIDAAQHQVINADVRDLFADDKVGNCVGDVVARWDLGALGLRPGDDGQLDFVLVDDPQPAEMRLRAIQHALPAQAGAGSARSLELVAGSSGGPGFRDGPGPRARFDIPLGVAADGAGHLYVGDAENQAIRRIDLGKDAEVHTEVALPDEEVVLLYGRKVTRRRQDLTQPASLAFDPKGRLHALDTLTDHIWRWDAGHLTEVYPPGGRSSGTPDGLNGPRAIAFDRDGSVLVSDSQNHRIVRIDLGTGKLTPVAGELGKSGYRDGAKPIFSYPEGIALDGEGHLFVTEWGNHTIREITLATGVARTLAGRPGAAGHADGVGSAAQFDAPSSVVYDRGSLYVAESQGLVVRRVEISTRKVTTLAGSFHARGAADGSGAAARFGHHESSALGELPLGLAIAGGDLYLSDSGNHVIRRITPSTGEVKTIAGTPLSERPPAPRAISFGRDGQMYFTAGQALYASPEGGAPRLLAGDPEEMGHRDGAGAQARFRGPMALCAAEDGALTIAEVNGTIRRVDPQSGKVTTIADLDRLLSSMTMDDHGDLYIGKLFDVVKISRDGKRSIAVSASGDNPAAIYAPLHEAEGMVLDGDVLYLLDETADNLGPYTGTFITIRRIDLKARTEEALATWSYPKRGMHNWGLARGLSRSADGALWITHPDGAILRFDPKTRAAEAVVARRSPERGLTLGPDPALNAPSMPTIARGGDLYFIDEGAVLRLRAGKGSGN